MASPLDKKTQAVYNALKGGGADVGTEQEFNDWFFAKGDRGYQNRLSVWKAMKAGGADVGSNYEEFRDWMGLRAVNKPKPAAVKPQPVSTPAAKPQGTVAAKTPQTAVGRQAASIGQEVWGGGSAVPESIAKPIDYTKPGAVFEGLERQKARNEEQVVKPVKEMAKKAGDFSFTPGRGGTTYVDDKGNVVKDDTYPAYPIMPEEVYEDLDRKAFVESIDYAKHTSDMKKELMNVIDRRAKEFGVNPSYGTNQYAMSHLKTDDYGNLRLPSRVEREREEKADPTMRTLSAAYDVIQASTDLIDEINKQTHGENGAVTFTRNLGKGVANGSLLKTLQDFGNNKVILKAQEQYKKDPNKLTEEQKILLDAVAINATVQSVYDPQNNTWAKMGNITGFAVPYMVELAMNPLSGLGKAWAKGAGKKVLELAAKRGARGATRSVSKVASRTARVASVIPGMAGNAVSSMGLTATIGAPRVTVGAQERMIGDVQSQYDDNGNIHYAGTENAQDMSSALWNSFKEESISNFTEIQSSMILGGLGLTAKLMPGSDLLLQGFRKSRFGRWIRGMRTSPIGGFTTRTMKRAGVHEYPGEVAEEIEDGLMQGMFGVDDKTFKEAWGDTMNKEGLLDTALGLIPMSAFSATLRVGGYGLASRDAKGRLRNADASGVQLFGQDGWNSVKSAIDQSKNVNELKATLQNVVLGGQFTQKQKEAAMKYAMAREGYKGTVLGEAAANSLDFGQSTGISSIETDNASRTVTLRNAKGEVIEQQTFADDEAMNGYLAEAKVRKDNDRMLNDIAKMEHTQTLRGEMFGEDGAGYTALFSDDEMAGLLQQAMVQAGYDESKGADDAQNKAIAANVTQVGTAENDILQDLVRNYNPVSDLSRRTAEQFGIDEGELQRILDKDPLRRTDWQQQVVDYYASEIHKLAYPKGELHTEASGQEGADAADKGDMGIEGLDPEVLRAEKDRYDSAIAARDEALRHNQAMAMRIDELRGYGADDATIAANLMDFDEEDVKAFIEGLNAEHRWQQFLNQANSNFEQTADRETDRRTFKGTMNGAQDGGIVTVVDADGMEYTLTGGDVTVDGAGQITGAGTAGAMTAIDGEGNLVVLKPQDGYTVAATQDAKEYYDTYLTNLKEQSQANAGIETPPLTPPEGGEGAPGTQQEGDTTQQGGTQQGTQQGGEDGNSGNTGMSGENGAEQNGGEGGANIPVNDKGRKMYHLGVDIDAAIDDILNEADEEERDPAKLADRRIKTAQRKLDELNKSKKKEAKQYDAQDFDDDEYDDVKAARKGEELPYGTEVGKYAEERLEHEAVINYYNQLKDRWTERQLENGNTGGNGTSGETAVNGGGNENVPDWTVDKASDARARGFRMENGHRIDRQAPIEEKAEGKDVDVKFDSQETPKKGKITVVDAGSLIPSHVNGQRNVRFFITEAQPKERTDAASELASTSIAQNVNPEEITGGVTAYTGSPVVNSRGEVIQGNNRTIGLQKMWGDSQYAMSQAQYKQYLMDHAEEFGLDRGQIEAMEHPVMVRMVDVDDEEAIRLGQKTAANTESGGKERIDAQRAIQGMGEQLRVFMELLFQGEQEGQTLSALIVENGLKVLQWMNRSDIHKPFITQTQYESALDKNGNLTDEAKTDLKKIVENTLFKDAPDRLKDMFYMMPVKAQNAILSTFFRDGKSEDADRILKDIQNAIEAFAVVSGASEEFRNAKDVNAARVAVKDVQKQTSMFGNTGTVLEKFDNFALELAILFKGAKQNTIRDYFNMYYDAVQGTGQGDLFGGEPVRKTKADAVREIYGVDTNGNNNENNNENEKDNGQEGSNALEDSGDNGTGGEPGNAGESGNGKPTEGGTGPAVGGGGTERTEREQYIASHPLTEAEIDASDAPKMRKALAKQYLSGANESELAKAAYTSIFNKKSASANANEGGAQGGKNGNTGSTGNTGGAKPGNAGGASETSGETAGGGSGNAGNGGAESDAKAKAKAKAQAIIDRMKKHGKKGGKNDTLAYNIDVLTPEQMDDMLDLVEAGAELGYTILDEVGSKEEWKAQMKEMIGESLKDATGYTDADVDELLDDLWNTPFDNDGQEKTVGEWAAEKGIVTNENDNDNGTEETGNGDTGVSGTGGTGTVTGAGEGSAEDGQGNGAGTGGRGKTGERTDVPGGNRNGDEGQGSGETGRTGESGTSTGTTVGGSAGSNTGGRSGRGGTNDRGGTGASGGQSATPGGTGGVGRDTSVEGAETSPAEKAKKAADLSREKVEYKPASIGGKYAIGSVIPSGVADAVQQAFERLKEQRKKEILDFVRDELGYSTNEEMLSDFESGDTDGLASEQVDAVALAINAMKSGKSFIVGDMTGVGKGRTAAALIRWGKKQGKKVLFVTESAKLFSDMYNDISEIGSNYMPFVVNDDTAANITDKEGNKVVPKPSKQAQSALWQTEGDKLPKDKNGRQYDFLMMTYSQAGSARTKNAKNKLEWIKNYAKDAIVIMDESHNASGDSNRGEYFKDIVKQSGGATFLSATYAKRPDNMMLYALKSSMSEMHMSAGDMLQAIKDYGTPMQEIMASALFGSGEMIRRERDFSDVKTTWTDPKVIYSEEEYNQTRKTSDKTMDLVNDIIQFQRDYVNPIVQEHEKDYADVNTAAALLGEPQTHAANTSYKSQVSNVVGLMVYAMKARKAAQMAIEQIKQGKKPVIAVENTFGSYVNELGGEIENADFGPIFDKGVRFSLKYTIAKYKKGEDGKYHKDEDTEQVYDAESELDENGRRALQNLRTRIQEYLSDTDKVDLSLSPIDLIKQMIADAGYNCGEITGRNYQLTKKDGKYRKEPFRADAKKAAVKFNGGTSENPLPENEQYQALILNVAGATGISLHSSNKFGNQNPRTMIILQPARDVNTEVQMRGRIDRTGQVHRGEYYYITSPIPAEQKLTMMLKQKLASLDAQSVGTKNVSSNKVEGQDMDNKYGDEVCYNYLMEHLQDVNAFLEDGLRFNNKTREWEYKPGLLYNVLKNVQRLDCDMQEKIINELTQRYADQIDYLNQNGINDLETSTMNLEASTIDKATFVKGKDNESVNEFAHDTNIERVEVNTLKKPMHDSDIRKKMKELGAFDENGGLVTGSNYAGLIDDKIDEWCKSREEERKAKDDEAEKKLEEKIRKDNPKKDGMSDEDYEKMIHDWGSLQELRNKHEAEQAQYHADLLKQRDAVYRLALNMPVGRPCLVPLTDDTGRDAAMMYGRFLGVQLKRKGDPRSAQAIFAVKDSRVQISIPIVNKANVIEKILNERNDMELQAEFKRDEDWDNTPDNEEMMKRWGEWWDKMIPKNTSRQIRYMITGNVLQACGSLGKYKGQIVTFTRRVPDGKGGYDIVLERGMLLAENFDPENFQVRRQVEKKDVWDHYDEVKDEKSGISCHREGYSMVVEFSKRKGEKLADHPAMKDETLKGLVMNGEVRASGKTAIMCVVKEENIDKALEHLYKEYGYTKEELFVMPDSTEKPDAIVYSNEDYKDVITRLQPKYGNEWGLESKINKALKRYRMDVNNEGLKEQIKEMSQLRQAYLRQRYASNESERLAWEVLIYDGYIERYKEDKEMREGYYRRREAILEELAYRGFKGTSLHLEQGVKDLDFAKDLFDKLNKKGTPAGDANAKLFERVFERLKMINDKGKMNIIFDETISNDTGGYVNKRRGRDIHYNWKYMNAEYISDQAKADTILHEMIHTLTVYAVDLVENGEEHVFPESIRQEMVDAVNELKDIWEQIKDNKEFEHQEGSGYGKRTWNDYGVSNVYEMLSEAGSNHNFRERLKKVNLWVKIKTGIMKFFGFETSGGRQVSSHDAIMERLDTLLENFNVEAWETFYNGRGYGNGWNSRLEQRRDEAAKKEDKAFNDYLNRYQRGKVERNEHFTIKAFGSLVRYLPNQRDLVLRNGVLTKAKGHDIDLNSLTDLPSKLRHPILAFESARKDVNGRVVLIEAKDNSGNNIVVAINTEGKNGKITVNDITSMYGKDSYTGYAAWAEQGLIVDGNLEKFDAWISSLPESNSRGESKSMLSNLRAKLQDVLEKQENERKNSNNLTLAQQFEQEREDAVERDGLRSVMGDDEYRKYMRGLWTDKSEKTAELREWVKEQLPTNNFDLYDTIDKYLKEIAEKGQGSQELWQDIRDRMKEATGAKEMSLREARWLSWLSGRRTDKADPNQGMRKAAARWRIFRRSKDTAPTTPDGEFYTGGGTSGDGGSNGGGRTRESRTSGTGGGMIGSRYNGGGRITASGGVARAAYNEAVNKLSTIWEEAYVDYAVSLRKAMLAIAGVKDINDIDAEENAYLAENHMTSIVAQKEMQFMRDYFNPLQEAVNACLPDLDSDTEKAIEKLERYMRIKHGLERNREFFVRDWPQLQEKAATRSQRTGQPTIDVEQKRQDWLTEKERQFTELQNGNITYREYLQNLDEWIRNEISGSWNSSDLDSDKSGIRNYTGQAADAFDEDALFDEVEQIEAALGDKADALWDNIRSVNQYSLRESFDSGMVSEDNYNHVSQMFHYYVPLRGFADEQADEVYSYIGVSAKNFGRMPVLMTANGRKSLSDSPLATMGVMAMSSIGQAERNKVKQKLLRFVRNRYDAKDKDRLISINKIWLEKVGQDMQGNDVWEERYPDITEDMSASEVAAEVERFNQDMEQKKAAGNAMVRRANLRIPYRIRESEKSQHMVEVKENGESYLLIVNGDPRMAQAINGLLNPSNTDPNTFWGKVEPLWSETNRFMSSAFTSWNPSFVASNTMRDAIFARANLATKEGDWYAAQYIKNYWELVYPEFMSGRLWKMYRNGDAPRTETEKLFYEFMENGGETGFVQLRSEQMWKDMVLSAAKKSRRGKLRKGASAAAHFIPDLIQDYNERAENLGRFACYVTSRQRGRSILRSVADAKDVSVNFNRKGAGWKSADKNLFAGMTAEIMRKAYLFFNPGVQSLALMGRNIKKHPVKFATIQLGLHFAMGLMAPVINKMLVSLYGDDDTAKDPYANLPEWTRRNNICIFAGHNNFVTIPLPIELRAFYGLGDVAAGYYVDGELKSMNPGYVDIVSQLSQLLPVDFMGEGGSVMSALAPDALKPISQVKNNKDWTGKPIQQKEDSKYTKDYPEWTKAFKSEKKFAVSLTKYLSNATGGDNVKPGAIDISPAYAMHLLEGYTGGMGQTVSEVGELVRMGATMDFDNFNMRHVPVAKRVFSQSDDRTAFYRTRQKYYKYRDDAQTTENYIRGYKKDKEDPNAYSKGVALNSGIEGAKMRIMNKVENDLKKIRIARENAPNKVVERQLQQEEYRLQESAVRFIENIEDSVASRRKQEEGVR